MSCPVPYFGRFVNPISTMGGGGVQIMPTTLLSPPPNFHTFLRPLLVITAYSVLSQGVGGHARSHILANQLTQSQQSG